MTKMVFNRSHRFYEALVAYLIHVASTFIIQDPDFRKPRSLIIIGGHRHVINQSLAFYSSDIIDPVLNNQLPTEVRLEVMAFHDVFGDMRVTNLQMLQHIVLQGMFVRYYEQGKGEVNAKYGSDHPHWPSVWNFARVVRNACAHNGINFTNRMAASVSWRSLTYSPSDNGCQIFHRDLWDVEIIYLMEEMEAAL